MGKDFAGIYRRVPYFGGTWAPETADVHGNRDAMAILAQGVQDCQDDDMRFRQDVKDALDYIEEHAGRQPAIAAYRAALNEPHPVTRRRAMKAAYDRLCRAVNGRIEIT